MFLPGSSLASMPSKRRSNACWRIPRSNSPVDIQVRRDRSGEEPVTDWTLHANGSPLPCSALAEYLPLMASLGSEAEFSGTMSWQLGENHWWIDLGGSIFKHVSLDRLFEQHAHRLSGTARSTSNAAESNRTTDGATLLDRFARKMA